MVTFIAWITFILLEKKLKSHEKVCKNEDFCGTVMPSKKGDLKEFTQYTKSDKMPHITYADIKYLVKKIDGYVNNLKKFSTKKISEHITQGYSMPTI